jgi:hypothetical protein
MIVIEVGISPQATPGEYRVDVVTSPAGEASVLTDLDVGNLHAHRTHCTGRPALTAVARTVAAIPVCTSIQTRRAIARLPAPGSPGRLRLDAAADIAVVLIVEERTGDAPIMVMPAGERQVPISTVHGLDALDAPSGEFPIPANPCADSDWSVSQPCRIDGIEEIRGAPRGHHGTEVRDLADAPAPEDVSATGAATWSVNYDEPETP